VRGRSFVPGAFGRFVVLVGALGGDVAALFSPTYTAVDGYLSHNREFVVVDLNVLGGEPLHTVYLPAGAAAGDYVLFAVAGYAIGRGLHIQSPDNAIMDAGQSVTAIDLTEDAETALMVYDGLCWRRIL